MQPEYTAYLNSPHQRVSCVECHIGPGASWFVRSKLSGVRQVVAVTFHSYDRPIPSPVAQLRPARETCEQCHWPLKFTGDRLIVRKKYSDDEKNTVLTTVLLVKAMRTVWHWPIVAALAVGGCLLAVDMGFFAANLLKIAQGGWLPLTIAAAIFAVCAATSGAATAAGTSGTKPARFFPLN